MMIPLDSFQRLPAPFFTISEQLVGALQKDLLYLRILVVGKAHFEIPIPNEMAVITQVSPTWLNGVVRLFYIGIIMWLFSTIIYTCD